MAWAFLRGNVRAAVVRGGMYEAWSGKRQRTPKHPRGLTLLAACDQAQTCRDQLHSATLSSLAASTLNIAAALLIHRPSLCTLTITHTSCTSLPLLPPTRSCDDAAHLLSQAPLRFFDHNRSWVFKETEDVAKFYTFSRVLGQGQFGTTRLVTELLTGKEYACKSISKKKLKREDEVEDVRREVQVRPPESLGRLRGRLMCTPCIMGRQACLWARDVRWQLQGGTFALRVRAGAGAVPKTSCSLSNVCAHGFHAL